MVDTSPILTQLAEVTAQRSEADTMYAEQQACLVKSLRSQNVSWSEIAKALGITKQAAHERFRDDRDPVT